MYNLQRDSIKGISPISINDADIDIARIGIEGDLVETIEGEKSPDNPSTIYTIGDDINLFDEEFEMGMYNSNGQKIDNENYHRNKNPINVLGVSSITISIDGTRHTMDIYQYDISNNFIKYTQGYTLNLESNTAYINISDNSITRNKYKINKGYNLVKNYSNYNCGSINFNLENSLEGEEHQEQNVIISLNEELSKIGDIKNKLFYNEKLKKYQIEKNINKEIFNGNENWIIRNSKTDTICFGLYMDQAPGINILSDKFNWITMNGAYTEEEEGISLEDYLQININKTRLDEETVAGFKTWLSKNLITLYYKTKEPEYIDLPEETQNVLNNLLTYKEYNILSSNNENGLEPILTLNYRPYFSDEIKEAFKTGITRAYLVITSTGFIINEENYLKDVSVEELRFVPDKGIFGGTVAKRATINFNNVDNSFTIEDEDIEVHIGAEYDGKVYYINFGNFIVQHPDNENTTDNTSFEALDYMIKLNGKFKDRLTYPCEMLDIALDICDQSGIELGDYNFRNSHFVVTDNQFVNGESNRVVASAIAYSAFSWARIGNDNKLYFDFEVQDNTSEEIDYDSYYNLNFNDKEYGPINRIILKNSQVDGENVTLDDDESIALNGVHELVIEDNPFAYTQEKREELIQAGAALFGFYYMPINSVNLIGYIYLDCKDTIGLTDMQQRKMMTYIFNHTITYNGISLDEVQSPAMTETETKYIYKPELTEAYKNTQIIVNKHEQSITSLVQKTDDTNDRLTQLLQDLEGFKFSVSSSGGNNLIKNSVGWAELDFWETDNIELFDAELEVGTISGSTGENVENTLRVRTVEPMTLDVGDYSISYVGANACCCEQYDLDNSFTKELWTWTNGAVSFSISEQCKVRFIFKKDNTTEIIPTDITSISLKKIPNIITNKSDEVVKNSLSKSAFQLENGIIRQSFEVELEKSYSVGFKIKKPLVGTGYVRIIGDTLLKEFNFETATEYNYESFDYTFKANTQIITVEIYSNCGMIITDLIANTGDILSQWQPYAQELYALGVQIDSNGVKTYDNVSEQEVHLTPTGLSGYYQNEQVFTINKDTTETRKFLAEEEINMPPIKIIKVNTGWDFVYID